MDVPVRAEGEATGVTDHSWETCLDVDARIGFFRPARPMKIYAPNALAVAITGQVSCVSLEHGPGRKVLLGRKWLMRARESAEGVQRQADELD